MYWVNAAGKPEIEKADLDGSNRHTVVANLESSPSGLTIDISSELIFWVDGYNKVIECANLNGTNRRTVASELPQPFALTQYKGYIYWTSWKFGIYRANKTNGLDRIRIGTRENIIDIRDILVFHSSRQEGVCFSLFISKPNCNMQCLLHIVVAIIV